MPVDADLWSDPADPAAAARPRMLLDTSVAVPAVLSDHKHHAAALQMVTSHPLGFAGHAWFETYSVLTRLPLPQRRVPVAAVATVVPSSVQCKVAASGPGRAERRRISSARPNWDFVNATVPAD